jgi:hypothetical protein
MEKDTIQLIAFNNSTWVLIKTHMEDIGEFLSSHDKTPLIAELIAMSVKLILSELILNVEDYKKYPAVIYSDEDFVDMVIDSMANKIPGYDDLAANETYIDEIRQVIWGHIKVHVDRVSEVLTLFSDNKKTEEVLTEADSNIFMECLTVAWVECILRERESHLLEDAYGE